MPIEILMPALSPTMTEGKLARWLKKEGDVISAGDIVAEIETDKATMEVESIDEGTLGKILVKEGTEGVPVNQLIALILEEGEDKATLKDYKVEEVKKPEAAAKEDPKSAEPVVPAPSPAPAPAPQPTMPAPAPSTVAVAPPPSIDASGERIKASPVAKKIAAERGINLATIRGTGPRGRIVKADVLDAQGGGSGKVVRSPVEYLPVPHTTMRKVIATRLVEAKQTIPHFYLNIECNLEKLLDFRKEMNLAAQEAVSKEEKPAYKLSVNDLVIKAVALAMKKVPESNASWSDEAIIQYNNVDVSVAVAIEGGLITPIIRNADQKTLPAISNEMKDLAARARANKLAPEEFQGGGFSISNLGMYGIKRFNAIVNPPQSCILAVGAGEERAIVKDGQLTTATIMDVTLSSDHRVVDGAVGAEFLQAFKRYIERPVTMVI